MRLVTAAVVISIAGLALNASAASTGKAPAKDTSNQKSSMRAAKAPAKTTEQPKAEPKTPAKPADDHGHDHATDAPSHDSHAEANTPVEAHEEPAAEPAVSTPAPAPTPTPAAGNNDAVDAVAAMNMLKEGNERWVAANTQNPSTEPARRADVATNGQHPFVTVLTCADSRLPVERLFDRGVGEIFTVRVAGNIAGDSEIATIEYGTGHLHTPLLVVMGHTKCGAVAAAVTDAEVHGKVAELVSRIEPAVDRAKRMTGDAGGDALTNAAIRENVWQTVTDLLKTSSGCRELVKNGQLQVVGAVCDVATGKVEFMGEHPWQSELVAAFDAMSNTATAEVETH